MISAVTADAAVLWQAKERAGAHHCLFVPLTIEGLGILGSQLLPGRLRSTPTRLPVARFTVDRSVMRSPFAALMCEDNVFS